MVKNHELDFNPDEFKTDLNPERVAYRDKLAHGIERVMDGGAETLAALVAGLNEQDVRTLTGQRWTEESLESELERLGR